MSDAIEETPIDPRKHVWIEITLKRGGAKAKLHTSKRPIPNGERVAVPYKEATGYVERGVARFVEEYLESVDDETPTDEAPPAAE